jgi:hypothetical protein
MVHFLSGDWRGFAPALTIKRKTLEARRLHHRQHAA